MERHIRSSIMTMTKPMKQNETANANFTYDEEKKEATLVVSFTDPSLANKTYTIKTASLLN